MKKLKKKYSSFNKKINSIQSKLIEIVKGGFACNSISSLFTVYAEVKYLLESNELVSYEHYFSNEFK